MANQLRGLLKLFGLRLGKTTAPARWVERPAALFAQQPGLRPVLAPLVAALAALEEQIRASSRDLEARALADPVAARLMSVPGVGPITALTFKSCIEDPGRFARSADAGAYAGLVPRRFQSGERDTKGHITKAGDPMLRRALYEAANNLLARVERPCALQRWGKALAQAKGPSAPASPSPASSPFCRTVFGCPTPASNGRNTAHGLTGHQRGDLACAAGPRAPGDTEAPAPYRWPRS
jgi:transposase